MLSRCIKEHKAAAGQAFRGNGKLAPEQVEIRCFKEENRRLKMENWVALLAEKAMVSPGLLHCGAAFNG